MIFLLLCNNVNPDIQDNNGHTALMEACLNNNKGIVSLFKEFGANPFISSKDGWTAKMFATYIGSKEIVDILEELEEKYISKNFLKYVKEGRPVLNFTNQGKEIDEEFKQLLKL